MAVNCVDRQTSDLEFGVIGSFLSATFLHTAVSLTAFLANRHKFPIAQRSPVLTALFVVAVYFPINMISVMSLQLSAFSCSASFGFTFFMFAMALVSIIVRFAYICVEYEASRILAENSNLLENPSNTRFKRVLQLRKFLKSPRKVGIFIAVALFLLFLPILPFVSQVPVSIKATSDDCKTVKSAFGFVLMFSTFVSLILCAFLFNFVRKVKENFFILQELKRLLGLAAYVIIVAAFVVGIRPIVVFSNCKFRFIIIVAYIFPMNATVYISFGSPLRKVRRVNPNGVSVNSEETKTKTASGTGTAAPATQYQDFVMLLKNPVKKAYFRQFMIKEFASENLLFWTKVELLPQIREDKEKHFSQIIYIFTEFCKVDSNCCVNISYKTREALRKNISLLQEGKFPDEDLDSIFHDAKKEIEMLMFQDSFSRFRKSPEWKAMNSEVQEVEIASVAIAHRDQE